jgi:hypothetical protein
MCRALGPVAGLAPVLAGLERSAAVAVLEGEVRDRLQALADTEVACPHSKVGRQDDGSTLTEMSAVELAARRADLQARCLEIERGLRNGGLVDVVTAQAAVGDAVLRMRTKMLALPAKIGASLGEADAEELALLLRQEVGEALAELASEAVSIAQIEAAHQAADVAPWRPIFNLSFN